MTNAAKDENHVSTLLGTLDSDGVTIMRVHVNTSNSNSIVANDDTTGSDNGSANAPRDDNRVPVAYVASEVDGVTPVALYINASNELLIDTN